MDDDPQPTASGWTLGKIIGLLLGIIGMVGFGACTLCGMAFATGGANGIGILILMGALMTSLSVWLMVAMIRKASKARQGKDNSNYP